MRECRNPIAIGVSGNTLLLHDAGRPSVLVGRGNASRLQKRPSPLPPRDRKQLMAAPGQTRQQANSIGQTTIRNTARLSLGRRFHLSSDSRSAVRCYRRAMDGGSYSRLVSVKNKNAAWLQKELLLQTSSFDAVPAACAR